MAKLANGFNHDIATIQTARDLREGGWSYRKIGELVGVPHQTVVHWCNERHRKKKHSYQKRRRHQKRIRTLHAAGLSYSQIAIVLTVDTGTQWDEGKVTNTMRAKNLAKSL